MLDETPAPDDLPVTPQPAEPDQPTLFEIPPATMPQVDLVVIKDAPVTRPPVPLLDRVEDSPVGNVSKEFLDPQQDTLFELPPPAWEKDWKGMPKFEHEELRSLICVKVHFETQADWVDFFRLIRQKPVKTSIWFPEQKPAVHANMRYASAEPVQPRYPVYVISKGRWESRLTSKALERIGVNYRIVIEPQEFDNYAAVIDPKKILVLPFSNLGQGSIPARNWVWEHSISEGHDRHWILDDNIRNFMRFQDNVKCRVSDGTIFRAAEDYTDRYSNVAKSGFQYFMFIPRKIGNKQPVTLNTRIYSCILINNRLEPEIRWRGRYNEDTDLSIRFLKKGYCTILFNAFLAEKMATMTMKGGNTESLYNLQNEDGRLLMAQSLADQHPDIVNVTRKWGRWQHNVNYRIFKHNKLKLRDDITIPEGADDYGMALKILETPDAADSFDREHVAQAIEQENDKATAEAGFDESLLLEAQQAEAEMGAIDAE